MYWVFDLCFMAFFIIMKQDQCLFVGQMASRRSILYSISWKLCMRECVFFSFFIFIFITWFFMLVFFGHCVIAVHFFALFQVIFCGKDGKTYGRIFIGNVFMWRRSRDYMLIFILKGCCSQFSYFYDPSLSGVGPHLLEVKCNLWLYVVHLHSTWWEVDKHHLLEDSIFHKLLCMDDVGLHQSSQ